MKKIAFVNQQGAVVSVISPGRDDDYHDGQVFGDQVAYEIPLESDPYEVITRWYRKNGEWKIRAEQPSEYHEWDEATERWVPNLANLLAAKGDELDRIRERHNQSPISFRGHMFDADATAMRNIQGWQVQLNAGIVPPPGFVWRDHNNIDHPADADFINGLGAAIVLRGTRLYQIMWSHKAALSALAQNPDQEQALRDVLAYDLEAGWEV